MTDNSKESRWSIPSAVSSSSIFGYSSDGWKFGNASSYSSMPLDTVLDYPFSIEFKVNDKSANNVNPIIIFTNSNNNYIGLNYDNSSNWFNYVNNGGGMSTGNVNYNLVNGSVIRLELTSDSIKTYVGDNLIDTRSHSLNPTDLHFNFQTGSNRYNVIKDFKIKQL